MLSVSSAHAINASPHIIETFQPDGTAIKLRVHGDERFNWQSDNRGYTVVREKGRYVYAARGGSGLLIPTTLEVGKADPARSGLSKNILPSRAAINQQRASSPDPSSGSASTLAQSAPGGTIRNLVVLIRFANHTGRTLPSRADIEVLFNESDPDTNSPLAPTGSVKEVYLENSYGQLTLESTVTQWIDVSNSEQYYADGVSGSSKLWEALREALDVLEADANFDFNDFDGNGDGAIDSIAFIHSGYGAEWGGTDAYGTHYDDRIWSHRWVIQNPPWTSTKDGVTVSDYHISPGVWGTSGSAIGRIGVIAHETGHFFGLPDLYDTDSSAGEGIGSYGMMANSWGFDGSQQYPPHLSPWSKINLGWVAPIVAEVSETITLNAVQTAPEILRIDNGFPANEYLLVENRQKLGFDARMPQGGLAIWHIDDEAGYNLEGYPGLTVVGPGGAVEWPENGYHYRVALLQADGNYNLERGNNGRGDGGDVFHAGGVSKLVPYEDTPDHPSSDSYQGGAVAPSGNWITNISPSGPVMQFDYTIGGGGDPGGSSSGADLAVADVITASGQISGAYANTAANDEVYQVLTEDHTGGRPSSRHDELDHVWAFNLTGGNHIFHIDAHVVSGNDADSGFRLFWSSSSSGPWTEFMAIPESQTADAESSVDLGSPSGTIYIRVADTNQSEGQNGNDSLHVDHLYIDGGAPVTEPPLQASNPLPADGEGEIPLNPTLGWTAGTGTVSHDVYFGSSSESLTWRGNQPGTGFDPGTLEATTTYFWRVDEVNDIGTTAGAEWHFTTGEAPPAVTVTLVVIGYKFKGLQKADLTWNPATQGASVKIWRDGMPVDTAPDSGAYTDHIDNKGGGSYVYKVCDADSESDCSNEVTVVF